MSIGTRVSSETDTIDLKDWNVPPECYISCPPHDLRRYNELLVDMWFTVGMCRKCGQTLYRIAHRDD